MPDRMVSGAGGDNEKNGLFHLVMIEDQILMVPTESKILDWFIYITNNSSEFLLEKPLWTKAEHSLLPGGVKS